MNMKATFKHKAGIYLTTLLLLTSVLVGAITTTADQQPLSPHPVYGLADYSTSGWATGADVVLSNGSGTLSTTVAVDGGWSIDVGTPGPGWASGTSFTVTITQNGAYPYTGWSASASGTVGGYYNDVGTVTLTAPPAANTPTVGGDSTAFIGATASFTAQSTDPNGLDVRYEWDYDGDGSVDETTSWVSSGTQVSGSSSYATAGIYTVKARAENGGGQYSSWGEHTITVSSYPPADPSPPSGPASGDHGTSYTYTASTTDPEGDNIEYLFDWDDGTDSGWVGPYASGATATADHTWTAPGTYDVTVTARDAGGSESNPSTPLSVTMANTAPPTPSTPSGPTNDHHNIALTYTTTAVTDPEGDDVEYLFDFGDGSDSGWITATSADHTYTAPGTYDVTVTARDSWDESSPSSPLSVTIDNQLPNTPSTPSGPATGVVGELYGFTTSADDPDGDTLEYFFDWDDGSDSGWISSDNANHVWAGIGTYDVRVKVRDSWDESDWSSPATIEIVDSLVCDAGGPYDGVEGTAIDFTGSASGGTEPYTWHWDFGDGETSAQMNPSHVYATAGTYTATLTVTDANEDEATDTATVTVEVAGSIVADAGGPYTVLVGESLTLDGSVTGGTSPYTWSWDLGDGDTADIEDPTHTYTSEGVYTVTLTVTDDEGLMDTDTATVTVVDNSAPATPQIDGPSEGKFGTEYTFSFTATDPDGDDVKFIIDWGDDNTEETIFVASGETIEVSHTWESESRDGETVDTAYLLKAKAVDTNDAESNWGTMDVTMPVTPDNPFVAFVHNIISWLCSQFPAFDWIMSLPVFAGLF